MVKTGHPIPRYRIIADRIERAIADGVYEPGEKIASIRRLAQGFDASINTLRAALELLQERGVVASKPRSGTFVLTRPEGTDESAYVDDLVDSVIEEYSSRQLVRAATAHLDLAVIPADLVPSRHIRAAMRSVAQKDHPLLDGYATFDRTMELRSRICQWELMNGTDIHPDHLVLASSVEHAVMQLLILLNPARHPVAVQSPTYYGHLTALRALGMPIYELPVAEDGSFAVGRLADAVKREQIALALLDTAVHNPTGRAVPGEVLDQVAALAAKGSLSVIEYGMFRDLRFGESERAPLYNRAPSGSVFLCSSYAETLVPSVKAAWVASGQRAPYVRDRWRATLCTVSALQLSVLETLLASREIKRHHLGLKPIIERELCGAEDLILDSFPAGTRVRHPDGGFALWVALPRGVSGRQVFRRAREAGIAIAPGAMFSRSPDLYDNHIRIAPGIITPQKRCALRQLGEIVASAVAPGS